jgi:hypothetical protein
MLNPENSPRLYSLVPQDPERVRITASLKSLILDELARDRINGRLSYLDYKHLRKTTHDLSLATRSHLSSYREVWGLSHPALEQMLT